MKTWIIIGLLLTTIVFGTTVRVSTFIGNCEYSLDGQQWNLVEYGQELPLAAHVRVPGREDSLELVWGDGNSIRLLGSTVIQIANIQRDANSKNLLRLTIGRIFARIQRRAGSVFEVETETAVAAVRGTRFGVSFTPGQGGTVVVSEGSVDVTDPARRQPARTLRAGQRLTLPATPAELPRPQSATTEEIRGFDDEYQPRLQGQPTPAAPVQVAPPAEEPAPRPEAAEPPARQPAAAGFGFDWAIGGQNIDGQLWNTVILSPVFRLGNFGVGLYIPLYFISFDDLGYPSRWYNADEWDFTSFGDGLHDIAMKIRFLEYQNDWILFRIGSLPNMTLGSGILVNNYANDLQFPAIRRVGAQIGLDFQTVGFEVLTGNTFAWDMAGARFFVRPFAGQPFIGKIALGVSGFYDRIPIRLHTNEQVVFGYAVDVDFPIVDMGEMLSMVLYSGVATLGYSDRINARFTNMKGLGWATGVKGSLIVLDYRAEYRYLSDGFIINYVDTKYDVTRAEKYTRLLFSRPQDYSGFLVEAGRRFTGLGWVTMRYEHLFPMYATNIAVNMNTLRIEAGIEKGVIKWGYGSVAYERANFNLGDLFTSFPGDRSVLTAQVYYAIAPGAFLGVQFRRFFEKDLATGRLVAKDTFGITTQMGF